jgi:hypothetical protein
MRIVCLLGWFHQKWLQCQSGKTDPTPFSHICSKPSN